ncbi:MAG TPA: S-adenosylmethionine decarboxylase [Myxococcaceae bacterium]|nr:S-adenosylmethionine decarboxylase [Myxococcaceae bacterium]
MKLGWHWILDARGCRPERIADPACLREVLDTLPAHLGLTAVAPPQHFEHREESGTTLAGLVLLAESHLSLHAHPALGVLQVDLFSCAHFEPGKALAFLEARYGFTDVEQRLLERGLPERRSG